MEALLVSLDIYTLMLMALAGYVLSFFTLTIIWLTHREIPGVAWWWLSGSCALIAQSLFTTQAFWPSVVMIWWANIFITLCLALFPVALQRFFTGSCDWRWFVLYLLVYLAVLSWCIFWQPSMVPRVWLAAISYMIIGTVIVWQVWRFGYPDYLPAVLVFTLINLVLCLFNLLRLSSIWEEQVRIIMDQRLVNIMPFLSMLLGSYLSTFGVLLLCTQHRALALRQLATQDPLTGVYNRRGLHQSLALRLSKERMLLAMIDLDDFKQINDRFGHEAGDRVLREVGHYLKAQSQVLVGRFGGEEFVLLADWQEEEGYVQCERLCREIAALRIDGIGVTISMGVDWIWPGEVLEQALHRADEALYQAKGEGKNRIRIWQNHDAQVDAAAG